MGDFSLEGILERLDQLDGDLAARFGYSRRFEIVVVGGSALILRNLAPDGRFTTDIDVLAASAEAEGFLARHDMNTDVSTFLYQYPEHWEDRRKKVPFDGSVLDVYTLSNEDLAITKLLAWRESDMKDLSDMKAAGNIDAEALRAILDDPAEVRVNVDEAEWGELLARARELMGWRSL